MTLQEYYNFPEGVVPQMSGIPHWLEDKPNFPCPADMSYAFAYYKGLTIPPIDTSNVTNMSNMFRDCKNFTYVDISNWDTSNVTNMNSIFYNCESLISLDLSSWDTSKVTDMNTMFSGCRNLTSLDLSSWNTSNVTTMSYMFSACQNLTSIDLSSWDTSNVTNLNYLFENCNNLISLDLSSWDTSKVTDITGIFNGCNKLTTLSSIRADSLNISSYSTFFGYGNNTTLVDFGGLINLKSSWNGSYCLDKLTALSHQSLINILNGLYDFTGNGETPTSSQGKLKLGSTHLATLSDDEKAIATMRGWILS